MEFRTWLERQTGKGRWLREGLSSPLPPSRSPHPGPRHLSCFRVGCSAIVFLSAQCHRPRLPGAASACSSIILAAGRQVHPGEKPSCPRPPRRWAQLSEKRGVSEGSVRVRGPAGLIGYELWMSVLLGPRAPEPKEGCPCLLLSLGGPLLPGIALACTYLPVGAFLINITWLLS